MPYRGICSIEGCGNRGYVKPYCKPHYHRNQKYGDPLAGRQHRGSSLALLLAAVSHKGEACLIWPYGKDWAGYGSFRKNGVGSTAHNFMCRAAHGEPPAGKPHAAHSCGNRACYNPNHIRWATPKENGEDRVKHGTSVRGDMSNLAILNEAKVRQIRAMMAQGVGQLPISVKFGVSRNAISAISTGRSWAHVK